MNNLTLVNQIDEQLGQAVDAPRRSHFQIQQIMDEFKQRCQMEQQREAQARQQAQQEQAQEAEEVEAREANGKIESPEE
jgi:hypothetical protein